ncbi:MAG: iron-sulfur cluster assembly accessory protein [Proteobacteria bacterium]|nr:iron-sulfur cluster assembly accessory protein [Pseudomonadota bacterium]
MIDAIPTPFSSPTLGEGIYISPQALASAIEMQNLTARYQGLSLRLYLEGKGCDGFYYGVTFDKCSSEDHIFPKEGLDIIIDPQALIFCQGATIEWVDDERGTGFLVENPQQWKFRGKFFKRKVWQEKLMSPQSDSKFSPELQS